MTPLFFVHRVVGGEHAVLIVNGYVRDVMEVASSAFRPRAAERPGRNRDLIAACPYNRLEGDQIAADPDPACRIVVRRWVVKRWNGGPSSESILLSNSGTIELAIPLIADRRQPISIREVATVLDDEG